MKKKSFLILTCSFILALQAHAAGPYGSTQYRKTGVMDGNQVVTLFYNYGMITYWPNHPSCVWPKGTDHSYVDGVALIVAASTYDVEGNLIHPLSSQYREDMDHDPDTNKPIGWEPLTGYSNPNQDEPAMSDDSETWPWTWPGKETSWDGYWNGYFGKGMANADLETYFAMDDSQDDEYQFYPDSTDSLRRGLGVKVVVRAFQWNHVLAEDCIFWHYDVENIGTTEYDSTVFGMLIDWGLGGKDNSADDCGSFDTKIDLAYAWDGDTYGDRGWGPVGYGGFAFLESPGIAIDNLDNDDDGIFDERRDNDAGEYIFGPVGEYAEGDVWHWSGDEDGDWRAYTDQNDNGEWDEGEPLNDDLGLDGVGPKDPSYTGPDFGEGDGQPDQGEPNFGKTDKDESDQIGLTAFLIFPLHEYTLRDEEQNWGAMSRLIPPTEDQLRGVNLGMMFYSGIFPLYPGERERFSMALLFGADQDDLVRNKKTVQAIYNANYSFAQPPYKPTMTAVPGDRKVILFWDDYAEDSYDRFLQEHDFEGYRIYRSTDPSFIDSRIITDAYGNPTYRDPLAQFDLNDGLYGPHLVGVYGARFDLGEDTGLRHSYIDTTVFNGITYYYAVVSYDYGFVEGVTIIDTMAAMDGSDSLIIQYYPRLDDDGQVMGIAPTECTSTILGEVGGSAQLDINTAMVTPNAPAAGYVTSTLENGINHLSGDANGTVLVDLILEDSLRDGQTYNIRFYNADLYGDFLRFPEYFDVYDPTAGEVVYTSDKLVFGHWAPFDPQGTDPVFWVDDMSNRGDFFRRRTYSPQDTVKEFWHQEDIPVGSPLIDGFALNLENRFIDYSNEEALGIDSLIGSIVSNTNYSGEIGIYSTLKNLVLKVPFSYEITWYGEIVDTSSAGRLSLPEIPVDFKVMNTTLGEESEFLVFQTWAVEEGDSVIQTLWIVPRISFPTGESRIILACGLRIDAPPNIFTVNSIVGMDTTWDTTFVEKILPGEGDKVNIIATIPFSEDDLYSFTVNKGYLDSEQEEEGLDRIAVVPNPYVATAVWEPKIYYSGRGPRKIDFINLPRQCTIRIYTLSGYLVKKIEHSDPAMTDGAESWNLVSKDGMDVAYGIYIYHVDAPGVGEKIGKFAVIK